MCIVFTSYLKIHTYMFGMILHKKDCKNKFTVVYTSKVYRFQRKEL